MQFIRNTRTGRMHFAETDDGPLACERKHPVNAEISPTVYGIHIWCEKCHAAADAAGVWPRPRYG